MITVKTRASKPPPSVDEIIAAHGRGENIVLDDADEVLCLALRLAVAEGRLAPSALRFEHADGTVSTVDDMGWVDHWPRHLLHDIERLRGWR